MKKSEATEILAELSGRLLGIEMVLVNLTWQWALSNKHPPGALGELCRTFDGQIAALKAHPETSPNSIKALEEWNRGFQQSLFETLQREALRRAASTGQDH